MSEHEEPSEEEEGAGEAGDGGEVGQRHGGHLNHHHHHHHPCQHRHQQILCHHQRHGHFLHFIRVAIVIIINSAMVASLIIIMTRSSRLISPSKISDQDAESC